MAISHGKFPTLCALFITMRFKKSWHLPNGTEIYEFEVLRLAHILETFRNAELHSLFFSALNSKSDQESSMLKQDRMKDPKMKKEALVSWSLNLRLSDGNNVKLSTLWAVS